MCMCVCTDVHNRHNRYNILQQTIFVLDKKRGERLCQLRVRTTDLLLVDITSRAIFPGNVR